MHQLDQLPTSDFSTERYRGATNDAFRAAATQAGDELIAVALRRMRWEQQTRGLSPATAHRETMEVVTRYLDGIRDRVEENLNDLYIEMDEKGIR